MPLKRKMELCVWDEIGDDCAGDIGNPLFSLHNDRFHVVGLRSYVETNEVSVVDLLQQLK